MNKKGSVIDILLFVIMAFIIVMILGAWTYGFGEITATLEGMTKQNGPINVSDAASMTFSKVNAANQRWLPILSYSLIIAMILNIFVSSYFVRVNPVFFIVYLFMTIGAVIVAAYISNFYEDFLSDAVLGATLQTFSVSNFIMLNLPIVVTVVGLFGMIFLFAVSTKNQGSGV